MPLTRGPDGRLGVARPGGGGMQRHLQRHDARRRQLPPLGDAGCRDDRAGGCARAAQSVNLSQTGHQRVTMSFHEVRFPDRDFARRAGRARTAHRCRRAGLGSRRAQQPLGRQPPQLQRRLRRQVARRSARGDRVFRGAARPAVRFSLARSLDCKSCAPQQPLTALDQVIGTGTGTQRDVSAGQNVRFGASRRGRATITKPVAGTVRSRSPASRRQPTRTSPSIRRPAS